VHVAKRVAEFYQTLLEWTEGFKRIPPDERYNSLVAKLTAAGTQMLSDIEKFSAKLRADIQTALLVSADEDVTIDAQLVLSPMDAGVLTEEIDRLLQNYGLN
jgi:hypothetical protein